ncbi:cadherin-like protein 26 isoform X2 [Xyrauchen texanus]|uniref:cadherin-like protein 26 isoform X2 n=1 Tax=Xyrauchen texanus TaxID=154827 RepID=UPI002241B37A|nr:cadherin-like protein 26 isoform X2 [Xyrauchen texanus]
MMKIDFFLFLLALFEVTASNRHFSHNREKRDAVLIRSKRRWVLSTIDLEENMSGPFPAELTQLFNDKEEDYNIKFRIKGEGVTTGHVGLFSIDENSGIVFVHRPVDREVTPIFHVDFDVLDKNTGFEVDKTLSFNVEIKDKNDNRPEFSPGTIRASFPENIAEGTLPATVQAHDNDQKDNPNSQFTMSVLSQEPAFPKLSLKAMGGSTKIQQLAFTGCFDYDKAKLYKVLVEARDLGKPTLSSTATVFLDVTDSNTHMPKFNASKYNAEVMEMVLKEILRIGVIDLDTPNTPASKAVFTIMKGNEEGNYKIVTDPKTNEGVLSVIKGKNYIKTEIVELEIKVENEEKLFQCVDGKPVTGSTAIPNTVKVNVKVIDMNDAPVFKKSTEIVYRTENMDPGDVLFIPEVKDEDSDTNKLRYELIQDTAKWVTIDPHTGKITTIAKLDRESPFVINDTYTLVMHAIDDGHPPATGTCTVVIYLGDVNDNAPFLISNKTIMCMNKIDRVNIITEDRDQPPYGKPFSFYLGGNDDLKNLWKLEPTTGDNSSLISLKNLPFGNYTVPLKIQDQQGSEVVTSMQVVVCDCAGGNVCRGRLPHFSKLGPAGIGLLLAGLLLLPLLLLFCFLCECGSKTFQHIPLNLKDEGNQTLVKYNEEGGGSIYKPEPIYHFGQKEVSKIASVPLEHIVTDGNRKGENSMRVPRGFSLGTYQEMYNGEGVHGMPNRNRSMARTNTVRSGVSQMSRSYSVARSDRNLAGHIDRKVYGLPEEERDYPEYSPRQYDYEGTGSNCESLDKLSVSNFGENMDFLQNLGPKFNTLGGICQQPIQHKNVRL